MHLEKKRRFYQQQWRMSQTQKREGENATSGEKPGLSPCLFIHLFLEDLFPLSKVRGATKECVSSEQGKTNTSSSYSVDWVTVHSVYWTILPCLNRRSTKINATFLQGAKAVASLESFQGIKRNVFRKAFIYLTLSTSPRIFSTNKCLSLSEQDVKRNCKTEKTVGSITDQIYSFDMCGSGSFYFPLYLNTAVFDL